MPNFDNHLRKISNGIASESDEFNWQGFLEVRQYVLNIMKKQSPYFAKICQDDILFGSQAHEVRINDDDEYDVLMVLEFPAYNEIRQVVDQHRPGYEFLDFSEACYDDMIANKLANNKNTFLNRAALKSWLHNVFVSSLHNYGDCYSGMYEDFMLEYKWRGITYTIEAVSDMRTFTIDFVPAVKIVRPNSNGIWHAVPKGTKGPNNTNRFTFMISNSPAELQLVARCGANMRHALRLLQSLRNANNMPKLRCYHFVTLALWMARHEGHSNVAKMSISEILIQLLSDLCDVFADHHMPYYWNSKMNLFNNNDFTTGDINHYHNKLCSAHNILYGFAYEGNLTFKRCAAHFQC